MYHNCKPINITPQGNFFMTSIPFALAESRDKPKFTMAVVYKILCISYLSFFFLFNRLSLERFTDLGTTKVGLIQIVKNSKLAQIKLSIERMTLFKNN